MTALPLTLACWDYDRTRPLIDGRIKPEGIDLSVSVMRPQQAFRAMLDGAVDVSEMSFANYVAMKAAGDCPLVAIPVMLSKMFRHSCIYVRSGAGIHSPADLKGKRAGTAQFTSTGGVFMKALLQHDHGIKPQDMTWVFGGLHAPAQIATIPAAATVGLDAQYLTGGQTLEALFEAGEIDVLLSNHFPTLFERGSPHIQRLFPDYKHVEKDYFHRTGIFPIMHVVVLRNVLHNEHHWVAESLYRAFCEARDAAVHGLYDTDALRLTLPWLLDHLEEARSEFGEDLFTYGIEPNRRTLTAFGQFMHEQGLAERVLTPEEMFLPGIGR